MNMLQILKHAAQADASDVYVVAGLPASMRIHTKIQEIDDNTMSPGDTQAMLEELYELAEHRSMETLLATGDDDFSFSIRGLSRFRVSAYKQRGSLSAVIRVITFDLPDYKKLGIPDSVIDLASKRQGMILVTGSAGSGKSTTLACMIHQINQTRQSHIITLEDPIEYLHRHTRSIVTQREIGSDTQSYIKALRSALRQSPDIILLGEMRDYETIDIAMTAAETGHLLLSTLHTIGAANTIERIIDVFPANQQRQIAVQLSMVLNAVVSQQLVPTVDGGVMPVFEIMTVTPAIRTMIRDNKIHQIEGLLGNAATSEMCSMDLSLERAFRAGKITRDTALSFASNPQTLMKKI